MTFPANRAALRHRPKPHNNGRRPGTKAARSSFARSFVPITSTASRSEAVAISTARHMGMEYADLVEAIIAEALTDAKDREAQP